MEVAPRYKLLTLLTPLTLLTWFMLLAWFTYNGWQKTTFSFMPF